MQEIIKNLELARASIQEKCDFSVSAHEAKMLEAKKIWESIISYRDNITQIDAAISVLRDSQNKADQPTVKEYNAMAEFIDSVIVWECSYVGGARVADIAKVCEYKFSSYEDSLSFIRDRISALSSCGRVKSGREDYYVSVSPGKVAKPFSVVAKVNGIRHGYLKLAPMIEPNVTTLRALVERQNWYKKHKYHTLVMSASYDSASNVFSMNRKKIKL